MKLQLFIQFADCFFLLFGKFCQEMKDKFVKSADHFKSDIP